jgi:hypothetical protein
MGDYEKNMEAISKKFDHSISDFLHTGSGSAFSGFKLWVSAVV